MSTHVSTNFERSLCGRLACRPAILMLVGQDWGTVGYFRDNSGRDLPHNKTNMRLIEFLRILGFEVGPPNQEDRQSGVFATNAILCLKEGAANKMSAPVKREWFNACRLFLRNTIEEAGAQDIVALGVHAYQAVAGAYDRKPGRFFDVVERGRR